MDSYQLAWTLYVIGGIGSGLAAWLLFRRWSKAWGRVCMVSLWVLLLTPYAIDAETMTMAPAIFILVMDGIAEGFETVKAVAVLLLGLWLVTLIVLLLLQLLLLRRKPGATARSDGADGLSEEELEARATLLEDRTLLDDKNFLRAER